MGLRLKIGATITATAALAVLVMGVQVPQMLADRERKEMTARLALLVEAYETSGKTAMGAQLGRTDIPDELRKEMAHGRRAFYVEDTSDGVRWLWAGQPVKGGTTLTLVVASRPLIGEVNRVMLQSGVIGVIVASVIGLALASRFGHRLRTSARSARRIADGDLTARLPESGNDEIAALTQAVNAMAEALASRLQAEREVTANIAHELRTPVAGLIAAAGLLAPGRVEGMVQERARRLRDLTEDVLEVARLDNGGEEADLGWVELGGLARRVVRAAVEEPAGTGPPLVRLEVIADVTVRTDPRRVERILSNLVSNALRHGAEPVLVQVEGALVRVRDRGAGFPDHLLTHGPQRFRTSAEGKGLGLGLTIAAGQAGLLDAHLAFENHLDGGAQATLHLDAAPTPEP
ncbi:HAMP domain-containing histidine kinase [Streptomyces sp. NBC_00161]|uniref:sensor histidine kinase n=1 Tax=Streptomyces sp. NBC_00161 TaxID=2975671 RepID=UPI003250DD66